MKNIRKIGNIPRKTSLRHKYAWERIISIHVFLTATFTKSAVSGLLNKWKVESWEIG
jgi:hypothetical protein